MLSTCALTMIIKLLSDTSSAVLALSHTESPYDLQHPLKPPVFFLVTKMAALN